MPCTSSSGLWLLADCNNFYASCERLFRPDLAGRPVVVLSNNDGCVIARSAEAKQLGIPMGAAEFKIRALLERTRTAVFSSNFALYGDLSDRVMQTLESLFQDVRQYSIDEAFCRLQGAEALQAWEAADMARRRVLRWTGIPVSMGIACTRTLAKAANRIAKQSGASIFCLDPQAPNFQERLEGLAVEDVWGIGRRLAARLQAHGIANAWRLSQQSDLWVRRHLGTPGWDTVLELRGLPASKEGEGSALRQTLVVSRSFGRKTELKGDVLEAVCAFAERACEKLRAEGLLAGGVGASLRTSFFGQGPSYAGCASRRLMPATDDTGAVVRAAREAVLSAWRPGYCYAKAGVLLYGLEPAARRQLSLLADPAAEARSARLMQALDAVNARYGRRTLVYASSGLPAGAKAAWQMKQTRLSPSSTTRWEELATARA